MALSDRLRSKDGSYVPSSLANQKRRSIALYLLLGSIGMLFGAAILAYLINRFRWAGDDVPSMEIPPIFYLSTVLAVVGSWFLWGALRAVRRERQQVFRQRLIVAFVLGTGFCISQSIGLAQLLQAHNVTQTEFLKQRKTEADAQERDPDVLIPGAALRQQADMKNVQPGEEKITSDRPIPPDASKISRKMEGLIFVFFLLHVLHFVGGMIALTFVTWRGLKGRYDHEYHDGLRLCAIYWRFLDIVWLVLFGVFIVTA